MADKKPIPPLLSDRLLSAIEQIDRPGAVCTSGDHPLVMPGLDVEGLGAIGLLGKTQATKFTERLRAKP